MISTYNSQALWHFWNSIDFPIVWQLDIISEQFVWHSTFLHTCAHSTHTHTHPKKTASIDTRACCSWEREREKNKSSARKKTPAATLSQVSNPQIYLTQWESNLSATQSLSATFALPLSRCLSEPLRYFLHYPIRWAASLPRARHVCVRLCLSTSARWHERGRERVSERASALTMWHRCRRRRRRR